MALNADTGEVLWEHRFPVTLSDVPPRRVGWASPVIDRDTGNVFAFGVGGTLLSLTPDGEIRWEHYLSELFGLISTHGGRTVSPIIEGRNVIISGVSSAWGELARGGFRFYAFDVDSGQVTWWTATPARPYDTTFSPPVVVNREGTRVLIAGGSDGAVHAIKVNTGEPVWRFPMSKRGINTGVAVYKDTVLVSHSEENLETSEMGYLAGIDARAIGEQGVEQVRWARTGWLGGFSSPVLDGNRLYQIDNSANLVAVDVDTGAELWRENLGTIQRASPVLADGKLYVGTVNGTFFVLRPTADGVERLSTVELETETIPEEIIASAAVARGRVYMVSSAAIYAIGPKTASVGSRSSNFALENSADPVAHVQVYPKELVAAPGDQVRFEARAFDARGRLVRVETVGADWSLAGLQGRLSDAGMLTVSSDAVAQTGAVDAAVEGVSGSARLRVIPPLPLSYDFEGMEAVPRHWINATGKFATRIVDGNTVLVKRADNPFLKRARAYVGATTWSDMTVQVDATSSLTRRRMGDVGLLAQRFQLILFGSKQRLELQSWQPETKRTVGLDYAWQPDIWYTLKLRTETLPDGSTQALGKVWIVGDPEPKRWIIEKIDPMGSDRGSPGIYGDAHAEVAFDNLKMSFNE